jgi:hypothetical protein
MYKAPFAALLAFSLIPSIASAQGGDVQPTAVNGAVVDVETTDVEVTEDCDGDDSGCEQSSDSPGLIKEGHYQVSGQITD